MSKTGRLLAIPSLALMIVALAATPSHAGGPFQFNSLTPCRIFDTRDAAASSPTNVTNGVALAAPGPHVFDVRGKCGIPTTAQAVTVNVTVTQPTRAGDLRVFAPDAGQPTVSTLNYSANEAALANGAIVPLAATSGRKDLAVVIGMMAAGTVHVLIDVTGYFQ